MKKFFAVLCALSNIYTARVWAEETQVISPELSGWVHDNTFFPKDHTLRIALKINDNQLTLRDSFAMAIELYDVLEGQNIPSGSIEVKDIGTWTVKFSKQDFTKFYRQSIGFLKSHRLTCDLVNKSDLNTAADTEKKLYDIWRGVWDEDDPIEEAYTKIISTIDADFHMRHMKTITKEALASALVNTELSESGLVIDELLAQAKFGYVTGIEWPDHFRSFTGEHIAPKETAEEVWVKVATFPTARGHSHQYLKLVKIAGPLDVLIAHTHHNNVKIPDGYKYEKAKNFSVKNPLFHLIKL